MKHFNCKRWVIDLLNKGGWKLLRGQTQRGFHPIWKVQRKGTFEGRRAWPLSEMKFGHLSSRSTRLQMPAVRYVLQIGTAKGHILPFPLLMKCQAIDPTFSSVLNHTPFDPPPPSFQSTWRSFQNLKDVGVVQVKVIRAEGLMAADVIGKTTATLSQNNRVTTSKSIVPTFFFFPM